MASLIDRYRNRLPVTANTPVVSLGEGSTPLLHAPRISQRLRVELYLKWEGRSKNSPKCTPELLILRRKLLYG